MKKYTSYILCFVFVTINHLSFAQKQKPIKLSTIGFIRLTGGTIILKALIDDNKDSLNFILDTGSGGISLDSSTAKNLNLKIEPTNRLIKGVGGTKKLSYSYSHKLVLPYFIVDSLDFHIIDYSIITSAYGIKVDGIIGYSFLKRFLVKVDYNTDEIEIYQPFKIKYPKRGFLFHPKFNNLPAIETVLTNNKKDSSSLIFDTGAGLNLLLSNTYSKDSNVLKKERRVYATQGEGLAGKQTMLLTIIDKIKIGKYTFRKVPTFLFDDEVNVLNYPENFGLIGNDLLKKFNLIINYPESEIHLQPNKHFYEDFDYAYTGLDMFMIDGKIIIDEVIANSPAAQAGLQPNDIVFAVDNNFSNNLQAYKTALLQAGESIKMIVLRNGEPVNVLLNIANIMAK